MRTFRHEALLYAGSGAFLETVLPFVKDGVDAGEPVLVASGPDNTRALRAALGEPTGVTFLDMQAIGQNPSRIIPVWRDFVDRHGGDGRHVRGVGEPVWPGRSAAELSECHRHEALLNLAFAPTDICTLVCPYDTSTLDTEVIEQVWRTHPYVRTDAGSTPSPSFAGGHDVLDDPLPEPPAPAADVEFVARSLTSIRRLVAGHARRSGLEDARVADLLVAVNEAATNSLTHGGGHGRLRLWRDRRSFVCEVSDRGRVAAALAGRVRPPAQRHGGRGLWLVNHLCDLVQLRSSEDGTVVRLHMWLGGTPTG